MPVTRSSGSYRSSKSHETNPPSQELSNEHTSKKPTPSSLQPGNPTSPIFFWKLDEIPYGPFCQWYPSSITHPLLTFTIHTNPTSLPYLTLPTPTHAYSPLPPPPPPPPPTLSNPPITFTSCEQWMMAHKAHLFSPSDPTVYNLIFASTSPAEQKSLGQCVQNFTEDVWAAHRLEIVKWGNYLKFTQNEELKSLLLGTGDRELVEASPRDRIWGVGFGAKNAERSREKWGLNLLGRALMEVRGRIRSEEGEKGIVEGKGGGSGDKVEDEGEGKREGA